MMNQGYREEDLVSNRAAVLLIGGNDSERRAWAEEAATFFPDDGPLRVAETLSQLGPALSAGRGVVFVPDVVKLGVEGQAQVLRCLQYQEERPKIVVALGMDATAARSAGVLREDLHYRLHLSVVNLSTPGLRDVLRARRAKAEAIRKEEAARVAAEEKRSLEKNRTTVHAAKKKPVVSKSRVVSKPVSSAVASKESAKSASSSRAREAAKPAKRETRPAAKLTRPAAKATKASGAKSKTTRKPSAPAKKSAKRR